MANCISPILIKTAGRRDFVPCGKCNFCLANKRADWSFRLKQEHKVALSAHFLTLTYSDEEVPWMESSDGSLTQTLRVRDVQLFKKKLRKFNAKFTDYPIRYFTVGEYGTKTSRPHYHSIMFNLDNRTVERLPTIWSLGNVHVGTVNPASIHYATKYAINRVEDFGDRAPPFLLCQDVRGLE